MGASEQILRTCVAPFAWPTASSKASPRVCKRGAGGRGGSRTRYCLNDFYRKLTRTKRGPPSLLARINNNASTFLSLRFNLGLRRGGP
eukprot:895027-Pyramimonas_sp.AAC.1